MTFRQICKFNVVAVSIFFATQTINGQNTVDNNDNTFKNYIPTVATLGGMLLAPVIVRLIYVGCNKYQQHKIEKNNDEIEQINKDNENIATFCMNNKMVQNSNKNR